MKPATLHARAAPEGFPHKIRGASAGWTRAVAIIDELMLTAVGPERRA
jgi:hypothetical protein